MGRLGISRDALSRTLQALIQMQLLERNTIYAHPLRPEYLLTNVAKPIAAQAAVILQTLPDSLLKKWALPTLEALQHHQQFSKLLTALPNITNRALQLTLQDLERLHLLEHSAKHYHLTNVGQALATDISLLKARIKE